jgi:hypothetical protein
MLPCVRDGAGASPYWRTTASLFLGSDLENKKKRSFYHMTKIEELRISVMA